MRRIKSYWWNERPNFGDQLAPLLLERFADIKVQWDTISHSQIISVGSILEHVPPLWDGHIIGSGKLHEFSRLHLHTNTAKIWALRGPLSARGIKGEFVLGDPGLLADELVRPQEKVFDLGIVPHWQDSILDFDVRNRWCPKPYTYTVINPDRDPLEIISLIGGCRKILTSSLHGMILADAFGIPRRVEFCGELARDGGDFKFRDYSESIKCPFEFGKLIEASRFHVEDRQQELFEVHYELGKAFQKGLWNQFISSIS
jgi:hypothetical protein